jgi:hypothetical protein
MNKFIPLEPSPETLMFADVACKQAYHCSINELATYFQHSKNWRGEFATLVVYGLKWSGRENEAVTWARSLEEFSKNALAKTVQLDETALEFEMPFSRLVQFAREKLSPYDKTSIEHAKLAKCPKCGIVPMTLYNEIIQGTQDSHELVQIYGRCAECEGIFALLDSYESNPEERVSKLGLQAFNCKCGNANMYQLLFELQEPSGTMMGIVVVECSNCKSRYGTERP